MSSAAWPRYRRVHFVGIGGIGMSGIAEVLINLGYTVSGSDLAESAATRRLVALGARVGVGHAPEHVADVDVVVVSSAVPEQNPEVRRARELGTPVIRRAEMLAELMRLKHGIAVAGSHGKTTTTSLAAWIAAEAGLDPTIVVGGRVGKLGGARLGKGDYLICEADESDGSFLRLSPSIAVVTNIDAEHLENYGGSLERLSQAFVDFCNAVPFYGAAIVCLDDAGVQNALPGIERRVITYGTSAQADLALRDLSSGPDGTAYTAVQRGHELGRVRLRQPGRHVALDSLAALGVALELGVPFATAAAALASFEGVDRRMTLKGDSPELTVYDDYAHHPTEIEATLGALREAHPGRRLVALFQPHRYSRVKALLDAFCRAFYSADLVLVLDIYAAGETEVADINGERLADGIRAHGHRAVEHVGQVEAAARRATELAAPGDVVVTLGAGDVWKAAEVLAAPLRPDAGEGGS